MWNDLTPINRENLGKEIINPDITLNYQSTEYRVDFGYTDEVEIFINQHNRSFTGTCVKFSKNILDLEPVVAKLLDKDLLIGTLFVIKMGEIFHATYLCIHQKYRHRHLVPIIVTETINRVRELGGQIVTYHLTPQRLTSVSVEVQRWYRPIQAHRSRMLGFQLPAGAKQDYYKVHEKIFWRPGKKPYPNWKYETWEFFDSETIYGSASLDFRTVEMQNGQTGKVAIVIWIDCEDPRIMVGLLDKANQCDILFGYVVNGLTLLGVQQYKGIKTTSMYLSWLNSGRILGASKCKLPFL